MAKILDVLRRHGEWALLVALLCLWSLVWDYHHFGSYQRAGREKLLLFVAAALAGVRIGKIWTPTIGVFYAYVVGSWLHFSLVPWVLPVADKVFLYQPDGTTEVACLTASLFLIPLVAKAVSRRTFEDTILAASLIHGALGGANLMGKYPFFDVVKHDENLPIGLLGQQTLLGPFLAYGAALACVRAIEAQGRVERTACAVLGAFSLVIALATKSSMTIGSLLAAGVTIAAFYFGVARAAMVAGLGAGVVALANRLDSNILWHSGRLETWQNALGLYRYRPWFGFGIGAWEPVSHAIAEVLGDQYSWTYAHSEPIQGLMELGGVGMGILGLAALGILGRIHFLYLFRDRSRLTWVLGLVVFGVNSAANFTLHIVPHGPIFLLCVYMIASQDLETA